MKIKKSNFKEPRIKIFGGGELSWADSLVIQNLGEKFY